MTNILCFQLDNRQEQYAECGLILEWLEDKGRDKEGKTYPINNQVTVYKFAVKDYAPDDIAGLLQQIVDMGTGSFSNGERYREGVLREKVEKLEKKGIFDYYVFSVEPKAEEDIINLQYFALLKQQFHRCRLLLHEDEKVKWEASRFLWFELLKYKSTYFICQGTSVKREVREMIPKSRGVARTMMPLIEIQKEEREVEYWQQTVEDFLSGQRGNSRFKWEEGKNFPQIFPLNMLSTDIKDEKEKRNREDIKFRQYENAAKDKKYFLLFSCKELFCSSSYAEKKGRTAYRNDVYDGSSFWEIVRKMPLLSFYIFNIRFANDNGTEYFIYDEMNYEILREQALVAMDIGDGILQLLENIYHTKTGKGYLSIRVHKGSLSLREKYDGYFGDGQEEKAPVFLEMQILDYSKDTIMATFKERSRIVDEEASCLSFFFAPKEKGQKVWDRYNEEEENRVHHYGLQIFDSLVTVNRGAFIAISSTGKISAHNLYRNFNRITREENNEVSRYIPGTQYSVLLPVNSLEYQHNTGLNGDINYSNQIRDSYKVVAINSLMEELSDLHEKYKANAALGYQERKERVVEEGEEKFRAFYKSREEETPTVCNEKQESGNSGGRVLVLQGNAEYITKIDTEIFCKIIILFMLKNREKQVNLMISNCESFLFVDIVRMFSIFYNKQGKHSLMKNMQLYLSGVDTREEFILTGENLKQAVTIARKLSFVRGVTTACIRTLMSSLDKRPVAVEETSTIKIIPFDLLTSEESESKITLFEKSVKAILEESIQQIGFGSKIEDCHVRLGSKIHIENFYEAELLFHNNYYTMRFAFLIVRDLQKRHLLENRKNIVLVGYEIYSEMLLYEMKKFIDYMKCGVSVTYIVYENRLGEENPYRHIEENMDDKEFIFIVPINSTLTTHNKIQGALERIIREKKPNYLLKGKVIWNYALIINRDRLAEGKFYSDGLTEGEERFWKENKDRTIRAIFQDDEEPGISYYVSVEGRWSEPLRCKNCYPQKDILQEKPLIQTNKESIIPMHKIGFRKAVGSQMIREEGGKKNYDEEKNTERVKELQEYLTYAHIERSNKHYEYYINTEKLFAEKRARIKEWLLEIAGAREKTERKRENIPIFNIIIAPMHFSNAGFVEEVNNVVFDNAALVLYFDIEKEFRENVKTKYSNILDLYFNLKYARQRAVICFYFVDDTIITGATIRRTQSIIRSIFPADALGDREVEIRVFESVILLLNRCSKSTIKDYIDDPEKYYSYVHLYISSMRNYEGACILCNKLKSAEQLMRSSCTGDMYEYWKKERKNSRLYNVKKCAKIKDSNANLHKKMMLYSHIATLELNKLGYEMNDSKAVEQMIRDKLLMGDYGKDLEGVRAFLVVLSTPFLNFRKSVKDAIFRIDLELLEFFIANKIRSNKLIRHIRNLLDNEKDQGSPQELVLDLLECVTSMGSNYPIRECKMKQILKWGKEIQNFELKYISMIKKSVALSTDEIKCVHLEHVLIYGSEFNKKGKKNIEKFFHKKTSSFYVNLYIENTRVLYDAIADLNKNYSDPDSNVKNQDKYLISHLNKEYYYENYRMLLMFNDEAVLEDGNGPCRIREFKEDFGERLQNMVRFFAWLQEGKKSEKDVKTFYNRFLDLLVGMSAVNDAQLVFQKREKTQCFIRDQFPMSNHEVEKLLEGKKYTADTYFVGEENIILKFCDYQLEGEAYDGQDIGNIYIVLCMKNKKSKFETYRTIKEILAFRHDILNSFRWYLNTDSSQELVSETYFKRQMLKARALEHSDKDNLRRQFNDLPEVNEKTAPDIFENYFKMLVNTYIGRINLQLLAGEPLAVFKGGSDFKYFYTGFLRKYMNIVKSIWNVEYRNREGKDFEQYEVPELNNKELLRNTKGDTPALNRLGILVIQALLSAVKYCLSAEGLPTVINIYKEKDRLVVKNRFDGEKEETERKIAEAINRQGPGISLCVIKEFFDTFFKKEFEDVFIVVQEVGKAYFLTRLPVFEEDENE